MWKFRVGLFSGVVVSGRRCGVLSAGWMGFMFTAQLRRFGGWGAGRQHVPTVDGMDFRRLLAGSSCEMHVVPQRGYDCCPSAAFGLMRRSKGLDMSRLASS